METTVGSKRFVAVAILALISACGDNADLLPDAGGRPIDASSPAIDAASNADASSSSSIDANADVAIDAAVVETPDASAADAAAVVAFDAGQPDAAPATTVITIAGNGTAGFLDGTGGDNGTAEFYYPAALAVDSAGVIYVADQGNNSIRTIDSSGNVNTLAGNGTAGFFDGTGGRDGAAEINGPSGIAVASDGTVFFTDSGNGRVRKIDLDGNVTTVAGNGTMGSVDGTGGAIGTAEFEYPYGIVFDGTGNLYVADLQSNNIREIDGDGNVTTVAGNGTPGFFDGTGGANGTAEFLQPNSVAVDADGNIFVADGGNDRIREIDGSGNVTTVTSSVTLPNGIAIDGSGNLYFVASYAQIGELTSDGSFTVIAGNGTQGYFDGNASSAEFNFANDVTLDASGNIYVADCSNYRIREIIR